MLDAISDAADIAPRDAVTDAPTAACTRGHVVISEVRSRGVGGAADESTALFNGTSSSVTFDSTWMLTLRSSSASTYTPRWMGTRTVAPAYGDLRVVGSGYTQLPAGDSSVSLGISDAGNIVLVHVDTIIDEVCFYFDTAIDRTLN